MLVRVKDRCVVNKTFLNKSNNIRYICSLELGNDEYVFASLDSDSRPVHLIVLTKQAILDTMVEDGKSMLKDRLSKG